MAPETPRTDAPKDHPPSNFAAILALLASLTAAGMTYVHFFVAGVTIDAMGLSLVVAIFLPWLLPYVKSFKFGGAEVELRELRKEVQEAKQIAQKADEIAEETREAVSEPAAAAVAAETTAGPAEEVVKAIRESRFAFRTPEGIARDLKGPDPVEVEKILEDLQSEGVVRRARKSRRNDLWTTVNAPRP
ncbi:ribosomal protein S25 [Rhodovulum iodosum]|uniref:Ribosomal protein S25 n=1 Tax=Rhodovulum iodosum TaxID=68291 RepID=A0ABV3XYF4_9RHOB|nr:hypothetical protein [Rhodovulum robiginosum]RSK38073.1 hypothetical protein EJA01_02870 [Rhodovulum robiginosum]